MLSPWVGRPQPDGERPDARGARVRDRLARGAPAFQAGAPRADVAHLGDRAARRGLDRPRRPRQRVPGSAPRRGGDRGAQRDPPADHRRDSAAADARLRVPGDSRARRPHAARGRRSDRWTHERRQLLVGAPRGLPRLRGDARDRGHRRCRRRQRVLVPRRPADRAPDRDARPHRRARDRLPRDRRAGAPRAAPCDAGRQRPAHGPLAGRGRVRPERVGDRPLLADRREPGRDPARVQRRHPGLPVGREGDGHRADAAPRRPIAPSSSGVTPATRGCYSTAVRAAGTCSPGRPTR